MWFKKQPKEDTKYPQRDISIKELQQAIQQFEQDLPSHIPLRVLINEDRSLDYSLLTPFLKAIPNQPYYMSKETYELFPEEEKHLAVALDQVQRAVDQYILQTNTLPVIDYDPYRKVNFFKLEQLDLIDQRPDIDFYITDLENLITMEKPE
ncbi:MULTISPECIES: DUF3939 domain-containing protein [Gracilibacillus]|uniref:DUF3939 domain-containing protein n=1 Tax=Gracilibacillus TaxID=74385 RepID=UPI0008246782|nr:MULTISPECIES: DUF3939 domain-containing protein [Gracilibacillus]